MTVKTFSRSLPIILAIWAICFGGCLSRSQTPRFYNLSAMPTDQVGVRSESPSKNAVVGIGPVKLADYLETSQIITRTSDNQVAKAEYDRWVGSFKDNFVNVLADNIGLLLPTEGIYLYPWRRTVPIDYQVTVDVVRCDGRLGEAAWLEARWSVFGGPDKKLLQTNRSSIHEPLSGLDYAAVVAAQSRALAKLSQEIVAAIKRAGKN
ncbi:MAG: membrane integrity-associated transporter subunit PqiC [Desulfobacteraceae bacterium]